MSKALLASALWYAQNGWHVFPVAPGQKVPITARGFHDATTDAGIIRQWWTAHPSANIGVATEASGLVVVDVDAKNDGLATFEALRAELGSGPFDTLTAQTPSGGQHLVYATDGSVVKSGAHVLGQGIDIRAAGGYIVAAPSVVNGKAYAWEVEYSPRDRKPLMWPDELSAKIVTKTIAAPLEEAGTIPSGERNATLASIAGTLRRRGLDFDEILAALIVVNSKRCNPKLPQADVDRIVQSICRYAPSDVIGQVEDISPVVSVETAASVFTQIHNRFEETARPLPFGVRRLDEKLGGMYPQMVTVLAARTGVGKTSGAEHIIERASLVGKVLFVSLEMTKQRIVERIAARRMGMPVREYREAGRPMDDPSWFDHFDLHFTDKSNRMTVEHIAEQVASIHPGLVVIDHARHIAGWLSRDGRMRADLSPAFIMHALCEMAVEQNTHVLLLSQVSRNADGSRPNLSDLRDSGSVEENADNVIFLHRPFQFGDEDPHIECESDGHGGVIVDDVMEWCVWKSREAGSFISHTGWRGPIMQIYDYPKGFDMQMRFERCCNKPKRSKRGAA